MGYTVLPRSEYRGEVVLIDFPPPALKGVSTAVMPSFPGTTEGTPE